MEENRLDDWARKWRRYWFIYRAILCAVAVSIVCVFRVDFDFGVITLVFAVYSWYWYDRGFYNRVVDEYEEGYPKDGLLWMIKSWFWLFVILAIIYFCFVSELFYKIILGVILFIFAVFMFFVFKL